MSPAGEEDRSPAPPSAIDEIVAIILDHLKISDPVQSVLAANAARQIAIRFELKRR